MNLLLVKDGQVADSFTPSHSLHVVVVFTLGGPVPGVGGITPRPRVHVTPRCVQVRNIRDKLHRVVVSAGECPQLHLVKSGQRAHRQTARRERVSCPVMGTDTVGESLTQSVESRRVRVPDPWVHSP